MTTIAVYRFSWYDHNSGKNVVSSRLATLKAIKLCNGREIEDSRLVIDTSALDTNEFYNAPTTGKTTKPNGNRAGH
jgi:hypothetical protein